MLHRLQLTLRRRRRILRIREQQQEQAEQELAVYLREEEDLRQERDGYLAAGIRTRAAMLGAFDDEGGTVRSDVLVTYVRAGESLGRLAEGKSGEIEALQPTIQKRREDVLDKYKTKRAMEILTAKTGERVQHEEVRGEQRTLDELTSQRYRGPNGSDESQ